MTTKPQTKKPNKYVWTCDFCGKEFKTKKESDKHELVCDKNPDSISFPLNRNIKKSWLVLWITTMIVFGITIFINSNLFSQGLNLFDKKWFLNLFFVNIIFGIIAFLGMVFTENKNKKKIIPIVKYSFVICLFYCLFNVGAVLSVKNTFQEQKQKTDYLKYQPQTTLTPTPTPKTVIQPTKKTVDTDPIIDCVSSYPNCNGLSIKAHRSQCSKIYCCGFSDGRWVVYPSEEKCNEAQNKAQPTQVNNPTIKPNNTGISVEEYNKQLAAIEIDCSFNSPPYSFNFGQLTSAECKQKTDAYWAERKAAIPTNISYPTTAPTNAPVKSQADIDKCKSEVREKYTNLINGCYIQYQGSASDACARGYQNLSSSEMSACY